MATLRQKLVAQNLLENTGKSVSQAMKEVGYKRGSYLNPQQLTRSKGWIKLMDKYLPDGKLLGKHRELVGSKNDKVSLSAIELAYKVKGKLKSNAGESENNQASQEIREVIFRIRKMFPDSNA